MRISTTDDDRFLERRCRWGQGCARALSNVNATNPGPAATGRGLSFLRASLPVRRRVPGAEQREPDETLHSSRLANSRRRSIRRRNRRRIARNDGAGGTTGGRQSRADGYGRHQHGHGRAVGRGAARRRRARRDVLLHWRHHIAGRAVRGRAARRTRDRVRRPPRNPQAPGSRWRC